MTIQFCGAAREVTGSAHLITLDNGFTILLDCGLYQGRAKEMDDFNRKWLFDPASLDCLILSHAHIDHSGRIPRLVKDGYRKAIHATHATRSLCALMLLDSAKIQEFDSKYRKKHLKGRKTRREDPDNEAGGPLYTKKDVEMTMKLFEGHSYDRWIKLNDQVEVLFKDAGHILGSASVALKIEENGATRYLGFTGDIGRPNRPILKDPVPMPPLDYLICESTYGDREHLDNPSEKGKFLEVIRSTCVDRKGKLLIPAFSVGRTQEVVYLLDQLETEGLLPKIPVYVDSPLAVNATTIFGMHPECFDNDLHEYMLVDDNPFGFNDLKYIRKKEHSKRLNKKDDPCIIISSSGMMNAGRVKHHLFHMIDEPDNTILIVGYCSPNTPGGRLIAGAEYLYLLGQKKNVKAHIEVMNSFSAHADYLELLEFLKNQRESLKTLFLVHGMLPAQISFKQTLKKFGFEDVRIPELGEIYRVSASVEMQNKE